METSTPTPGEDTALALLFVHGIGLHSRAATIIQFGTRLLKDLTRWLPESFQAQVVSASIESELGSSEPAHALIQIRGLDGVATTWLIAESWWSGVFSKPRYRDFAAWGVKIAPVTIAYHMQRRFDRALDRFVMGVVRNAQRVQDGQWGGRFLTSLTRVGLTIWQILQLLGELALFMGGLFLIPLVVALIAVLVLIGFVPIPPIQRFIRSFQRVLTGSIGDSFIFLDSPLQRAAIVNRIAKDFEWVRNRSQRQVLVAHSQGAAVSHEMIRNLRPDLRPASFITFGSGIKKLNELREIKKSQSRWLPWLPTVSFLAIAWFAVHSLRPALQTRTDLRALLIATYSFGLVAVVVQMAVLRRRTRRRFAVLIVIFGFLVVAASYFASSQSVSMASASTLFGGIALLFIAMGALRPQELRFNDLTLGGGRWIDIFASNDPVPNGSLSASGPPGADPAGLAGTFEEHEVHNTGSMIRDHSTYWINSEQFVVPLIQLLGQAQEPPVSFVSRQDWQRLSAASYRRRWRVRWLSWIRSSVVALAFLPLWNWTALVDLGSPITNALGLVIPWIPGVDASVKSTMIMRISNRDVGLGLFVAVVAGWIVVAVTLFLAYSLLLMAWKWWTSVDISAFFDRRDFGQLPPALFAFMFLATAFTIGVVGMGLKHGLVATVVSACIVVASGLAAAHSLLLLFWKWPSPVGIRAAFARRSGENLPLALVTVLFLSSSFAAGVFALGFGSSLLSPPRVHWVGLALIVLLTAGVAFVVPHAVLNNWASWSRGGIPEAVLESRARSLSSQLLIACQLADARFTGDLNRSIVVRFFAKRIPKAYELLAMEGRDLLAAYGLPLTGAFAELRAALDQTPSWVQRSDG